MISSDGKTWNKYDDKNSAYMYASSILGKTNTKNIKIYIYIKITIKKKTYQLLILMKITKIMEDSKLSNSRLELDNKGDEINYVVINTLRRIIFTYIPIYSFVDFNIKKNTSVYHNTYTILKMKQIPIWNIKNDNIILYENEEQSALKQISMYVNYKNKSNYYISVTTDDATFYYNGEQITSPYNNPIEIVK